jgi:integrase
MICFVFKPKRRRKGELVEARLYSGKIRLDGDECASVVPLRTTDRQVAVKRLHDEIRRRQREAEGLAVPRADSETLSQPFKEHLESFLRDLRANGRAPLTLVRYSTVIPRVLRDVGWQTLRDADAQSFTEWRARQELRPKTLNDYLGALNALLNWLVKQRRIAANPLQSVEKVALVRDVSYRRAFTVDEARRLLAAAPASRGIVHLTVLYTGLRGAELRGLRWSDVQLEGPAPHVLVRASISKNRRATCLPLRPELVEALLRFRGQTWSADAPVFPSVPRTRAMYRDLAKAGIPLADSNGRRVDFHALRHTFGTYLSASGVPPRHAMELMRHSDLKLTMKVYTDAELLPLSQGVDLLPTFSLATSANDTQRDTQKLGGRGHLGSEAVATGQTTRIAEAIESVAIRREKTHRVDSVRYVKMERAKRFELSTSTLARWCSTN